MDRGLRLRTAHRRSARPHHPSRPHPGDERRQLPAQTEPPQKKSTLRPLRPSTPTRLRGRRASSATLQSPFLLENNISLSLLVVPFYSAPVVSFYSGLDTSRSGCSIALSGTTFSTSISAPRVSTNESAKPIARMAAGEKSVAQRSRLNGSATDDEETDGASGPTVKLGQLVERRIFSATDPMRPLATRPPPCVPRTIKDGPCLSANWGIAWCGSPSRSSGTTSRELELSARAFWLRIVCRSILRLLLFSFPSLSTSRAACDSVKACTTNKFVRNCSASNLA